MSDTGIGIPSNRLDNLFAEFMQADNSITRRFGGTGLGLAISKRLIDQMNGSITVESTSDVGTTFTVRLTLPLASENPVEMKGTDDGDDVAARFDAFTVRIGRKLRILFVEDNPTNQFVATQLLKGFNVHLDMAGNGLEALDSVSRFTHDLICMDMRMPEMDGLEATRQIRRMGGRMAEIPIIALTANAFKEDIDACMASGMNRFVAKPVRRDILLGAMLAELSASMTDDDRPGLIPVDPPALDLAAFDELFDMIGEDGVVEMVGIFETETRRRLSRLAAGDQDATTMSREMHTLKGAAGTVAAPYLAALGRTLEHALAGGIAPSETDLRAIEAGLNAFLAAVASNAGTRAEAA